MCTFLNGTNLPSLKHVGRDENLREGGVVCPLSGSAIPGICILQFVSPTSVWDQSQTKLMQNFSLNSELTILQIYRPLKVSCLLAGYSIHWWMLPLSPSDGTGAWRKAAQGSHHVRQWSQTSNLDQVRAKIQHTPHRRVLWAILGFFSFFSSFSPSLAGASECK